MSKRLAGKVAIISGGGRGMGVTHARAFINEGAKVVSFDINHSDEEALLREFGEENFMFLQGDVTKSEDWIRICTECEKRFGAPTVLVNNAGISPIQNLSSVSEKDYRRVIDINQVGAFLGIQAVIPHMRKAGHGSIINIASTAAIVGFCDIFPYVASKWAVRGMTKAAALELAGTKIRVNTVCPGDTDTPMLREVVKNSVSAAPPATDLPMKRWAMPEEISHAVIFLASDEASYISGTDLIVDGGYTAH